MLESGEVFREDVKAMLDKTAVSDEVTSVKTWPVVVGIGSVPIWFRFRRGPGWDEGLPRALFFAAAHMSA